MDYSLSEIQKVIKILYNERGYYASPTTLALGVAEEAGEAAQAVLITATPDFIPSQKKLSPEWSDVRDVASEIGDCITYLLALANSLGIEPKFKWMKHI